MLLLDTHVWVWSAEGDVQRIGRRARALLSRAESQGTICVSPVSLFELTALYTLGRLRLARPLQQWIDDTLEAGGIRIVELSPGVAVDAGSIARTLVADPLDRLLVATARQLDATFLTGDILILDYASATGAVRVHDARV